MIEPSMEELILNGVVEVAGVDSETGEFLYNFTPKLREVMPELWNERLDFIHGEIMFFWENGFIEAEDMDSANPKVILTDLADDEDAIAELPKDKQESLREIKRMFEK
jgi:hypothetical protein